MTDKILHLSPARNSEKSQFDEASEPGRISPLVRICILAGGSASLARFIEPAWKMLLSNKGLLPILWELNPGHPLLLPAYRSREEITAQGITYWLEKPFFGREGAGISLLDRGKKILTGASGHQAEPLIYQKHCPLFQAGEHRFIWGLWMVGDQCCGLSARGDHSPITGNLSRFFPHRIE